MSLCELIRGSPEDALMSPRLLKQQDALKTSESVSICGLR